jgi:hypothetical protein
MRILSGSVRQPSPPVRRVATDNCASSQLIKPLFARKPRRISVQTTQGTQLAQGAKGAAPGTYRGTVERARWTDERHDARMTVVDRTFDHIFEELRAERAHFRVEMRASRAEMRAFRAEIRDDMSVFSDRLGQLDERLHQLDERLGRIGFRAAAILATGLITLVAMQLSLVATQLWG